MAPIFSQGHALIIGVGGDLPNTVDDATGLADILTAPGRCAYPFTQVNLLTAEQAHRQAILTALDALNQRSSPQATVVIFFSGHGYKAASSLGEAYFLMPFGYDTNQLYKTAISGTEFTQKLAAVPAQKLLVLLDCCHAGGVGDVKAPGLELVKSPLPPETINLLAQGSGRVLVASSKEDELSYGGKPYSAFTLALIEAFCGIGSAKQDGFVRAADLALHAREVVPGRTHNRQHPILHFKEADNFVVAYYAGGDTQPKGLPFTFEPEIEPEPGAWSLDLKPTMQTIKTGGGAFIGRDVNTGGDDFIGRDRVVKAEHGGVAIGGDVTSSMIVTGQGNVIGAPPVANLEEFSRLLAEIRNILPQAGLRAEHTAEIQEDLARVEAQITKPNPDKGIILKRLDSVVEFLANTATVLTSAPRLYDMAQKALSWAQQLFK